MEILNQHHIDVNGVDMDMMDIVQVNKIVAKLIRVAASPRYDDSWRDIAGYGDIIADFVKGPMHRAKS